MADVAIHHGAPDVYEPSLFGTYSNKIGMWLFIMSDSLTFGALLFSYSYGRLSSPLWPTPFHRESIIRASIMTFFLLTSSLTMVLGVAAARRNDRKWTVNWLLATMLCGAAFVILHALEWHGLISEGLRLSAFAEISGSEATGELANVSQQVPQFAGTFFTLTGMHMLHVTIGVVYLGVVALRKRFLPVLLGLWLVAWLATPAWSPFHYGAHVLLIASVVCAVILFLKPKIYDDHDVEVAGLYWHFVDLVWMFIFPLVYLMSTRIL